MWNHDRGLRDDGLLITILRFWNFGCNEMFGVKFEGLCHNFKGFVCKLRNINVEKLRVGYLKNLVELVLLFSVGVEKDTQVTLGWWYRNPWTVQAPVMMRQTPS